MPFDFVERKRNRSNNQVQRIYVSTGGDICVETKHMRQTFSPEEFIGLLRIIALREKERVLLVNQRKR